MINKNINFDEIFLKILKNILKQQQLQLLRKQESHKIYFCVDYFLLVKI